MKRTILAMAVTLIVGLTSAFANKNEGVNQQAVASFNKDFASAKNVIWQQEKDYVKAIFTMNNQVMFAYYNENGELLGVTRNILSDHLPIQLLADLRKNYSDYWISDLFEIASENQTTYYISIENAGKSVVLKSNDYNEWTVYKKTKKNLE